MAVVEIAGLSKHYGSVRAVDGVSLVIEHGMLVCLLGPSGCGKTTTLRMLAGFIAPTAGEIRVGGRVISSPARTLAPEHRNMSMIFQSYALWPHLTVAENVAYGLQLRRLGKAEIGQRVTEILAVARLAALADRYPGDLSGGQQQRVSLARALVVEPETLLLDEPLSNLDANLREEMRFEIRRLHDQYRYTTVYVTHDQAEAMTAADLIVVMNGGRIEQAGTPEQIYGAPRSEFVARFIGGANILRGERVGARDIACGGTLIRCGAGDGGGTGEAAMAIRFHDVELSAGSAGGGINELTGVVARQVYLGSHRDYLVDLPTAQQIRVIAPTAINVPPGASVRLTLPPQACRALSS